MGFYFTLSGFAIMHVYEHRITSFRRYGAYIGRRLSRIYPLFFVTFILTYIFGVITNNQSEMLANSAIIPNLLLIQAWNTTRMLSFDYPSWSLSAEMFVYLLFPVFLFMINRLKAFAFALPFAVGLAVAGVFHAFGLGDWMAATFNGGCLRAAPSFVAGMVVHRLTTRDFPGLSAPAWLAHGLAAATTVFVLAGSTGVVSLICASVLVFVMVIAEPKRPGVLSRPLVQILAHASYGVYLLHVPVMYILLHTLPHRLGLPAWSTYALAPVALAVTAVLAVLSLQYFETPVRRYIISIIRRSPDIPGAAKPIPGDAQ
jgi:peptidoglycan/LPS O-acetylase OafA/YrhL